MKRLAAKDTLVPAIALAIRRQIWLGQLAPGEHINQRELATRLRVSVIPLREAIRTLQAEGLLQILPHRGVQVMPVTAEEVEEFHLEMQCLVTGLLPIAVPMLTDEAIERLKVLAPLMDAAYGAVDRNLEQWDLLLGPLKMPRLHRLVEQIVWRYGRYRNTAAWAALEGALRQLRPNRADILEAFIARDGPGAVKAFQGFLTVRFKAFQGELTR